MNLPYRRGVGIFLLNKKKKLWVGRRLDIKNNFWQMPQGGIDENESETSAMLRELKEEIGSNNIKILMKSSELLKYDLPKSLIKNVWRGRFKGQVQRWFACEFMGDDDEININFHKPEFSDWKWIDPKTVCQLAVPFKKDMYYEIIKEFGEFYI